MRVILDNNIIIDALEPRPPYEVQAKELFRRVMMNKIEGYVTANSLTDIFYGLSKKAGAEKAKTATQNISNLLEVIDVLKSDCKGAFNLPMTDFEDAVVAVCTKKVGADCIVSRDEKFIKADSGVKVIKPEELIRQLK
ncbi:toxin PIN [Clostridia bacterium]|nr:toxin PIN [Clostridia bacterium]